MTQFRISQPAQADLVNILATSDERWGPDGRRRYALLLAAAMRRVAADPKGPLTHDRDELLPGVRSFHLRHARSDAPEAKIKHPVHFIYYRVGPKKLIDVLRVLYDRMDPRKHLAEE